ncbi:uncharacterized protein A4U43_C04F35520 [Asparagus officinalis]|uniref:Uncharacterized protein n=1 Tax=Asparagus officinalis TaxID=4686 RepID=A0A5P1FAY8_ASPOF|nr:uncharacterized protein A4U43_C04F35520 [Asparagus officinalis]
MKRIVLALVRAAGYSSVHAVHVSDIFGMEAHPPVQVIHASTPNVEIQQAPKHGVSVSNSGTISDTVLQHPMHSFSGNLQMENPWKQVQRSGKIIEALQSRDCSMLHASTPTVELQQAPKYGVHVSVPGTSQQMHTFSGELNRAKEIPGAGSHLNLARARESRRTI